MKLQYDATAHVCQLPQIEQKAIRRKVTAQLKAEGYSGEELAGYVEDAMNSRICDLEDTLK